MRGPSRATTHGGWVGVQQQPGPRKHPCPRCPAGPYASCLRWRGEHEGGGRWVRIVTPHRERVGDTVEAASRMRTDAKPCQLTDTHGNHWHGGDSRHYCRGVL